jgi:hypothetical protein
MTPIEHLKEAISTAKRHPSQRSHRRLQPAKQMIHRTLIVTLTLLLINGSVWAGSFRVHYSIRGSGRDITVQAESSAEARRTVMDMFPGSVVTGAHRVKR